MHTYFLAFIALAQPHSIEVQGGGQFGSGTVISASPQHGTWILTARHISLGAGWKAKINGRWVEGSWYRFSKHDDLALLWTPRFLGGPVAQRGPTKGVRIATRHSARGLPVTATPSGNSTAIYMPVNSEPGMSGGGLFCPNGRLIGVLAEGGDGFTTFTGVGRVEAFLGRLRASHSIEATPR